MSYTDRLTTTLYPSWRRNGHLKGRESQHQGERQGEEPGIDTYITELIVEMTIRQRALLSGVLGACASCLAKFALSNESPLRGIRQGCNELDFAKFMLAIIPFVTPTIDETHVCVALEWVCRLICLVGMIITNAFMMGAFLEGMEESGSVAGAGLVTAANFGTSAVLGLWLWNEQVHGLWYLGFTMVLCGAVLLSQVTSVNEKQKVK